MTKYNCASDSLRPGQLDRLTSKIKDHNPTRKPQIDRRTTSQRVTDEMNELRTKITLLREALQGLMDLHISGEKYGVAAKEAWDTAVKALKSK